MCQDLEAGQNSGSLGQLQNTWSSTGEPFYRAVGTTEPVQTKHFPPYPELNFMVLGQGLQVCSMETGGTKSDRESCPVKHVVCFVQASSLGLTPYPPASAYQVLLLQDTILGSFQAFLKLFFYAMEVKYLFSFSLVLQRLFIMFNVQENLCVSFPLRTIFRVFILVTPNHLFILFV